MKCLMTLGLAAAVAAPAALAAQPAISITVNCGGESARSSGDESPILHGNWDFLMDVSGELSFGLMSIGFSGQAYGGSVTPARTAPVVIREIRLIGDRIEMIVASPDGDIRFDGTLSPSGERMCGTVTYHGGRTFPMVAQKRPSTYQWRPQARRAR